MLKAQGKDQGTRSQRTLAQNVQTPDPALKCRLFRSPLRDCGDLDRWLHGTELRPPPARWRVGERHGWRSSSMRSNHASPPRAVGARPVRVVLPLSFQRSSVTVSQSRGALGLTSRACQAVVLRPDDRAVVQPDGAVLVTVG